MDFGKVLDDWDDYQKREQQEQKRGSKPKKPQTAASGQAAGPPPQAKIQSRTEPRKPSADDYLSHWLALHGTEDKDESDVSPYDDRQARIRNSERLHRMAPQAVLDLHGKTATEAEADLDRFLTTASRQGLEKVLVIHGKGNHSANEGIMADLVKKTLENSALSAGFGFEDRQHGGRGATWVILRKKDYFSR